MSDTRKEVGIFIDRWEKSGAAERANCQSFLSELCTLLDVPPPEPTTPDTNLNAYVFERDVTFHHGDGSTSTGRIDLEAKQGICKMNALKIQLMGCEIDIC